MDTLKHVGHSALTVSVTKSTNVSSRMQRHYNLAQVHSESILDCVQVYFRLRSCVDNILVWARQALSCEGPSICIGLSVMCFPFVASFHKFMKVQELFE